MRILFALILIVGIGLAGFAVYLAQDRISQYQTALELQRVKISQQVPTTTVVVANRTLRYGERIGPRDVREIAWPANAVPEGTFRELAEVLPVEGRGPRTALRAMERHEPIMAVKVTAHGEDAGVSSRLRPGMRAFAISVDVATGVSGFLSPGDRVDVYWTGNAEGQGMTRLILDGVRLIAIDQMADGDRNSPTVARTVTVEATPEQVARLAQAQATGRLSLSLRGIEDDAEVGQVELDQRLFLGLDAGPAPEPAARVCTVRTRRGGEVVEIEVPCPTDG